DSYVRIKLSDNFAGNVWVLKGSKPIFQKSYGRDHRGMENNPQTPFNLASMGKMFTAVALLRLREQGKVDFNDTVGRFLPQLKNTWVKRLTIGQLLTHTSGMGDYFETELFLQVKDSLNVPGDYLRFIEVDKPSFPAGTDFRYSNTGFSLLGIIIEKLSGMTYRKFLNSYILTPSGMRSTVPGNGDGGGFSTSQDLVRFALALTRRKLLGPEATKMFFARSPAHNYGYGSEHHLLGPEHIVGHSGSLENLNNEFNIYTKSGYLVVILSNTAPPFAHHLSNKIKGLLVSK
ncbi:MAG TPA: serine hydrolase domain-containing protein, partial [Pedobacter sp.]|nr:serine hydrolase domain-containing protein [Pedobacter sp.]